MIGSVHVTDDGPIGAGTVGIDASQVPGLRGVQRGWSGKLNARAFPPNLDRRRSIMVAMWEDDAALDAFLASGHPAAVAYEGGWRVRLDPVRVIGEWDDVLHGVPPGELPDGSPVVALTVARLRGRRFAAFRRATARAEKPLPRQQGFIWAMGYLDRPDKPELGTVSLWRTVEDMTAYAYRAQGHLDAMGAHAEKPFHTRHAVIRCRPYRSEGRLTREPTLAEDWMNQ